MDSSFTDPLQTAIVNAWNGNIPLWVAFWVYGHMVYGLFLGAFIAMYKLSFDALKGVNTAAAPKPLRVLTGVLGAIVNVVDWLSVTLATVFVAVVIWRAAPNTDFALWGLLARGYVVLFFMFIAAGLATLWCARKSNVSSAKSKKRG